VVCKVQRDNNQTLYTIPSESTGKTAGGRMFAGSAELIAWWTGGPYTGPSDKFVIKQENNENRSDVIELTHGQVYDLIYALNHSLGLPMKGST
jgi:hypothetical protein